MRQNTTTSQPKLLIEKLARRIHYSRIRVRTPLHGSQDTYGIRHQHTRLFSGFAKLLIQVASGCCSSEQSDACTRDGDTVIRRQSFQDRCHDITNIVSDAKN